MEDALLKALLVEQDDSDDLRCEVCNKPQEIVILLEKDGRHMCGVCYYMFDSLL